MATRELTWWEEPRERVGVALASAVESLALGTEANEREVRYLHYAQLTANQQIRALRDYSGAEFGQTNDTISPSRWSYNVCKAGVRTASALIGKNTPRIQVLASDGTRKQRKRAELSTKFLDGLFALVDYNHLAQRRLTDALTFDIGWLKWFGEGSQVRCERRFPWDVMWDPSDARHGAPLALYDTMRMHVSLVIKRWKLGTADALKVKQAAQNGMVWVDDAWVKPVDEIEVDKEAEPDANGDKPVNVDRVDAQGRHTVHAGGVVLKDEPWPKKWFPLVRHVWDERPVGFAGQGLCEDLEPYQSEITRILTAMQRNDRIASVLRVAMEIGTQVGPSNISNESGSTYVYRKQKPEFWMADSRAGDSLNRAAAIFEKALEVHGISRMASSGSREPGIDAAVAIRELRDVQTDRLAIHVQDYDNTAVEDARVAMATARDLYVTNKELRVRAPGTRLLDEIDWKDIGYESEDDFIIRRWPTGILPQTPAGRRQLATEDYKAGNISRLQYLAAIQEGDESSAISLELAPMRAIERAIENILEHGEYETPDEFIAPDLAIKMGYQAINQAIAEDANPKNIKLLRTWVDEVARLQKRVAGGGGVTTAAPAVAGQAQAAATSAALTGGAPIANAAGPAIVPTAAAVPTALPVG